MRKIGKISGLLIFILAVSSYFVSGQEAKKIYDPSLDGMKQIEEAVTAAKTSGRHVLVQYGGNWCPWCIKFDGFSKSDPEISRIISENYIPVKLNYSPENKNESSNVYLGNPVRFGFPVFIILDAKGKVIHIQDSGLLESGEGYDQKKVAGFLGKWTAKAIVPAAPKPEVKK